MPTCPKCGSETEDGAAKCFYCGTRLRAEPKAKPQPIPQNVPQTKSVSQPSKRSRAWVWVLLGIIFVVFAVGAIVRSSLRSMAERAREERVAYVARQEAEVEHFASEYYRSRQTLTQQHVDTAYYRFLADTMENDDGSRHPASGEKLSDRLDNLVWRKVQDKGVRVEVDTVWVEVGTTFSLSTGAFKGFMTVEHLRRRLTSRAGATRTLDTDTRLDWKMRGGSWKVVGMHGEDIPQWVRDFR
jgi:hypothetical protein